MKRQTNFDFKDVCLQIADRGSDYRTGSNEGVDTRERSALGIGDVHRPALAVTVAGRLAQQLGKHAVHLRALGQAMPVPAVRAGDVIGSI